MGAKNRNVLYGYKFENGIIVVNKGEAKIVKKVFNDYINGCSLLNIANQLTKKKIDYLPNLSNWNKNKIKRIIEDKRYLGNDKYPQIIEYQLFNLANNTRVQRDNTKNADRTNPIYKLNVPVICPECGGEMKRVHNPMFAIQEKWTCKKCGLNISVLDKDLINGTTDVLNFIISDPSIIKSNSNTEKSNITIKAENEIQRMLESQSAEEETIKQKILELASLKYSDLNSRSYLSKYIKSKFEVTQQLTEISLDLLSKAVKAIRLNKDSTISLILKNEQIIRKADNHDSENSQVHSTNDNGEIRS